MLRMARRGSLAVFSVLVLFTAACGAEEAVDEPDAAATEEAVEPTDEPADEAAEEAGEAVEEAAPEPEEVTAYVVGYHWGWAVFDEDGTELDAIEVPVGSEVELIAVNDHAAGAIEQLPAPVAETINSISWHDRAHQDMEQGHMPDLEEAEGVPMGEALTLAHDGHDHAGPTQDHALLVAGLGIEEFLDSHGDGPARMVFTVDEEGTYEFRCTEDCGAGHDYQRREMLRVTG
jgi:hypothetical protein